MDPFHCEPFHDQEPAVNLSAYSTLRLLIRNVVQFATGAAYDPVGEAKSTQGAVDPMEVNLQHFASL